MDPIKLQLNTSYIPKFENSDQPFTEPNSENLIDVSIFQKSFTPEIPIAKQNYSYERKLVHQEIIRLEKKFSIRIIYDQSPESSQVNYKYYDYIKLYSKISILESQLDIYPPGFFNNIGLRRIYIGHDLVDESGQLEGICENDYIITTLDPKTIHHEIFHGLENGKSNYEYANRVYKRDDPYWSFLSYDFFDDIYKTPVKPGFDDEKFSTSYGWKNSLVNKYSEARAEIGALLIYSPEKFAERIQENRNGHFKRQSQFIKSKYYARSHGMMDEKFWKDLKNGVKINQDYWIQRINNNDFIIDDFGDDLISSNRLYDKYYDLLNSEVNNDNQIINILERIVENNPNDIFALEELFYYYKNNQIEKAKNIALKLINLGSKKDEYLFYLMSQSNKNHITVLENLIYSGVKNPNIFINLSIEYAESNQINKIHDLFEKSAHPEHGPEFLYYYLVAVERSFSNFNKPRDEDLYERAMNRAMNYVTSHWNYRDHPHIFMTIIEFSKLYLKNNYIQFIELSLTQKPRDHFLRYLKSMWITLNVDVNRGWEILVNLCQENPKEQFFEDICKGLSAKGIKEFLKNLPPF